MIALDTLGHPARRREIVEAARALAAAQGWSAVTVRAIAGRIGCSAPAIYQYFRDKDAVLAALASDGRQALALHLDQAIAEVHGPAKRMRAVVRGLWDFALANRELYAVIYGLDGLAAHRDGSADAAPDSLRRVAAELVHKRQADEPADDLADRVAATVHGFLCLALTDAFPGGRERALTLLLDALDALVKGLERR